MNYYLMPWKKYAVFKGRSRRAEYWVFILVNFAILVVLAGAGTFAAEWVAIVAVLFALAALVPSIAVTVRRLHDIGRTGWWWLIQLVPYVGWIPIVVFACFDSQPGENKYGPNPKGAAATPTPATPPPPPQPASAQ